MAKKNTKYPKEVLAAIAGGLYIYVGQIGLPTLSNYLAAREITREVGEKIAKTLKYKYIQRNLDIKVDSNTSYLVVVFFDIDTDSQVVTDTGVTVLIDESNAAKVQRAYQIISRYAALRFRLFKKVYEMI